MRSRTAALVATLGSEPQVVTLALDELLRQRFPIGEIVVIHTGGAEVLAGLRLLSKEITPEAYPGVAYLTVPVDGASGTLQDFRDESDVWRLINTLYRLVRDLKRAGKVVHLSIAGGRKVMSVAAMVAAQLLFGPDDRVWHLLSEGWRPGSAPRFHAPESNRPILVPVPVLRWTDSAVLLAALADLDDPAEAVQRYEEIVRGERMRRRREFVERWLTRAERDVARLACEGLDNAGIARRLSRSERTVANQLTRVYDKLQEWLGFPTAGVSRPQLLAELVPYFSLGETRQDRHVKRSLLWTGTASDERSRRRR